MADNVLKTKPLFLYVVAVWLLLVSVFAVIIIDSSINSAKEAFTTEVMGLYHIINNQVNTNEAVLDGFAATVNAMGKLDRTKIRDYARRIRARYPDIFMFEIAEKVRRQDKTRFENAMRQQVYPGFTIRGFAYNADRQWHPTAEKAFYLPITFMEPFPPESRQVLGLDLDSNTFFVESLEKSAKLNIPVSTKPFELVEGKIAYVIHRPIKDKKENVVTNGVADRYVMLVLLAKSLFGGSLATMPDSSVTLYHSDFSPNSQEGVLYKQTQHTVSALPSILLPKLTITLPLESKTQPFVLLVSKQLGWGVLNWGLLGVLFIVAVITFSVVIRYAKAYHLTQINRIQEANHFFYLANHDSLTGLANRNLLMDRLQHALKQAKRMDSMLAVLFLDLDNFKQINDSYGHDTGDTVLKCVAERLLACVRSGDTLARRSGDEFVIILENISSHEMAEQVIEKIQNAFEQHFDIDDKDISIAISIGLALYPEEAETAVDLLALADRRMYEKK